MEGELIDLNAGNLAAEHLCCALSGAKHRDGVEKKRAFLASGFDAGLTFRKLDARGKVFIEYAPVEVCSRPIEAPGYLVIHCLWVSGRFKQQGFARALLDSCLEAVGERNGVVAVSGSNIWLTRTEFFVHHGFEVVDSTKSGFDLVCYRSRPDAPTPRFTRRAHEGRASQAKGVLIEYVHQCPLVPNAVREMSGAARDLGLAVEVRELSTPRDAQGAASPFGTFGVFLHGEFLTHGLMGRDSFTALLRERLND